LVQFHDAGANSRGDNAFVPNHAGDGLTLTDTLTRLIQQGRDREAAELAAEQLAQTSEGGPMDPNRQLDEIVPLLDGLVASLDEGDLDLPTPCVNFNVRQVLEHMIGGATVFAAGFRSTPPPELAMPSDVRAAFPTVMADLRNAMQSPGAFERTINAPFGEVPGEMFARFLTLDGLVHGWDIATASGQVYDPPADVVSEVDAFARQAIQGAARDGDTFADPTEPPPDADTLTRLVAFTGRKVD
jgi:uncharacterized protein (TIGR03086 family)